MNLSARQTNHMKCHALFSIKNEKKNVIFQRKLDDIHTIHMKCQTLFSMKNNKKRISENVV